MLSMWESLRLALVNVRAYGFRSMLTVAGIAIGVTSVIAVVSIMQGLSYSIDRSFDGLGANSLTIHSYTPLGDQLQGKKVVCVMSGGNIDAATLRRILAT